MPAQLSMFEILEPTPAPPAYVPPIMREVATRAYGGNHVMNIEGSDPDPIEIDVRGTSCVIKFSFGLSTYVIQPPGSLFWSETGFRSFSPFCSQDPDEIRDMIIRYIDAPAKNGNGCGGKLVRWWPSYILQWRGNRAFALSHNRQATWTQWGPDKHAEAWANHDTAQAEAVARMQAEGIDPDEIGPPSHFKKKWPSVAQRELL